MIDTIRLESPPLQKEMTLIIQNLMIKKTIFDTGSGIILQNSDTASISHSTHHNKIFVSIQDTRWTRAIDTDATNKRGVVIRRTFKTKVPEYLIVECSLHKFMNGHNCYNGSNDIINMVDKLVDFLSNHFNVFLPTFKDWQITRLDYAEVFRITNVKKYINYMKNCSYPRRKTTFYGDECIYFSGSKSTFKIYNKALEFKKHDFKKFFENEAIEILKNSENLLRCEFEIRKTKLTEYGKYNSLKVKDIDMGKIIQMYDKEVQKIYGLKVESERHTKNDDVYNVLCEKYGTSLGSRLHSNWVNISLYGKKQLCNNICKTTYYRHLKLLKDANISLTGSNIIIKETKEFKSFLPVHDSLYKIS